MKRIRLWAVLTGIAWALAHAGSAPAQQPQPGARKPPARAPAQQGVRKPPAKPAAPPVYKQTPPRKGVYETYQPLKRLRTRADVCIDGETMAGAFCVNNCMRGFALLPASNPPRCRSIQPLPEGKAARPEWKETAPAGAIKPPPAGAKKRKSSGGM